jgi:hypothetical protein
LREVLLTFAPEPGLMGVAKASLNGAKCEKQ